MSEDRLEKKRKKEISKRKKRIDKVKRDEKLLNKLECKAISRRKSSEKLFRRLFAVLVDWYLASLIAAIPVMLIYSIQSGQATTATSLSAMPIGWAITSGTLAIILATMYYVYIPVYVYKGQTPGKKLFGVKVINVDNSDINLLTMLKREVIGVAIFEGGFVCTSEYIRQIIELGFNQNVYSMLGVIGSVVTMISVVMVFATRENRMIHDFIGKTKVIEVVKEVSKQTVVTI